MATMKSVRTGGQGRIEVVEVERPVPGANDVLLRIRACGICGTDATFVREGGVRLGPGGSVVPLAPGHEPAGEVAEVGALQRRRRRLGERAAAPARPDPHGYPNP
ncbi:alcohol dehydrogenase catalytic domain-containing protein [Streptomyces sp. NPDC020898]|uniref:alcohol dehydrogenase catalytic domain-containing protein n=1 Tax=Streptomyces sp. NPDC020898 TaxID=3365101 RepID=UPI0037A5D4AD